MQSATSQKAPELFPNQFIGDQVAKMQHDEAAMRRQQAAGPDTGEIRHQDFIVRLVFDAAEQGRNTELSSTITERAVHAKLSTIRLT